jgi:tetratricopeptide (TPR) repeat protein
VEKCMVRLIRFAFGIFVYALACSSIGAQDDSGLPTRIGSSSRCDWAGPMSKATIRGSFNVTGIHEQANAPKFTVAVYAGGVFVSRQRIKNGGTFLFYCVPDKNVYLVAEADLAEIGSFTMGSISLPPQINYQDIYLNWVSASKRIAVRNEVVSVQDSYERTKENQKRFNRAMARINEDKGEATVALLAQLVADDPRDYISMTEIGNINYDNAKYIDAVSFYEKALEVKADFINALFGLGRAQLAAKKPSEAIESLLLANKINPNSADINHFLGEAYLQNKQGTLAIAHMRRAIEISPDGKSNLHLRIAWLYNAAGAKDLAVAEYKLLLEKKPNHPDKQKLLQYIVENSR